MDEGEEREREKALKTGINHYLRRLAKLSPLEQLELIKDDLRFQESREIMRQRMRRAKRPASQRSHPIKGSSLSILISLIDELAKDLSEGASGKDEAQAAAYWDDVRGQILIGLNYQLDLSFPHYLNYCYLHALLANHRMSPLQAKYRSELRGQFDISTGGKLRNLLMETLKKAFYEEVKHGGSTSELDDKKRLEFLATYNRFLAVIKLARKEKRSLKKQHFELEAKRQVIAKFEIPSDLMTSTFSDDSPGEVALDWALQSLSLNWSRDYAKRSLSEIRKEFQLGWYVVDCDFPNRGTDVRLYAVHPRNNPRHLARLRYTPLEKSQHNDAGDPDNMLVNWRRMHDGQTIFEYHIT